MSADPLHPGETPATAGVREAWSQVTASSDAAPVTVDSALERFTSARMERIMQILVALGATTLGGQALVEALGSLRITDTAQIGLLAAVFLPLLLMIVSCVSGAGVRMMASLFAVVYLACLGLWPLATESSDRSESLQPWIFFLVGVAVVAGVLAFPLTLQVFWALAVPMVYGAVRVEQGDFAPGYWVSTGFDVTFTLILCGILVTLGWMLRLVARGVDRARERAIAEAGARAAEAAAEEERVVVAALMHDSVLAALLAAERAEGPRGRDLAVAMAREALTRLANTEDLVAEEGTDRMIGTAGLVAELRRALSELGADAVVEERGRPGAVPERVARSVVLAARQAIGNAVVHAQGRGLHLIVETRTTVLGWSEDGTEEKRATAGPCRLTVSVLDAGPGFEPEEIPDDRLGVRASIVARMAAVSGSGQVLSESGAGTSVVLAWDPEGAA